MSVGEGRGGRPGSSANGALLDAVGLGWAVLFARLMLGLLFLMQGWAKVFVMGPVQHARRLFIEPYAESWIPEWLLLGTGVLIPFVELIAGALLLLGLAVRPTLVALAALLLLVTYGHLLAEPFFDVTTHVFPRALLVLVLFAIPRERDRWSLDRVVERLRGARVAGRKQTTG